MADTDWADGAIERAALMVAQAIAFNDSLLHCTALQYSTAISFSDPNGTQISGKNPGKNNDSKTGEAKGEALLPNSVQINPDLAAIVAAWATLPPAIRAAMLALTQAATKPAQ